MRSKQDVTILEARSRPGGRVLTLRDTFDDGLYADAGAARIADVHRYTLYWAKRFGLRLEAMYPSSGQLIEQAAGRVVPIDAAWLSSHDVHCMVTGHDPWRATFTHSRSVRRVVRHSFTQSYWYRIRGGTDLLPHQFAAALGQRIEYGAVVTELEQDSSGVNISYRRRGKDYMRRAELVICALPHTTLRHIRVSPAFTPAKAHMIEQSGQHESSIRIFVQVADDSCLAPHWNGYGATEDRIEIWHPTFTMPTRRRLLALYAQADCAKPWIALDVDRRLEMAAARLDELFPGVLRSYERAAQVCWDEEPWSLGAQSHASALSDVERQCAARAEGRIHFAGEHTSHGWMDGALESGHRVAREILDTLRRTPSMQVLRPQPEVTTHPVAAASVATAPAQLTFPNSASSAWDIRRFR